MSGQATQDDFSLGFNFTLEIDNIPTSPIVSVDGLSVSVENIDRFIASDGKTIQQKVGGIVDYGDLTVTRGVTRGGKGWYDWREMVRLGKFSEYRRNGSIVVFDTTLKEQARWNFLEGWPSQWSISGTSGGAAAPIIETLVIAHHGLERA